jgi:hypothetical protein
MVPYPFNLKDSAKIRYALSYDDVRGLKADFTQKTTIRCTNLLLLLRDVIADC